MAVAPLTFVEVQALLALYTALDAWRDQWVSRLPAESCVLAQAGRSVGELRGGLPEVPSEQEGRGPERRCLRAV